MIKTSAAILIITMILGAESSFAISDPVFVNTSQNQNRRWEAVSTNEIPLRWEWNKNATSARLEIVGMNTTFTTNFTLSTSNYLWRAFPSTTPTSEDVHNLTLTFYAGGGAVVGKLTARLAVVNDAFGTARVISTLENKLWSRVRENVVIPYDVGWLAATASSKTSDLMITRVDGVVQTNVLAGAEGYYGWKLKGSNWGYGMFNLALTFPGTEPNEWDATLMRLQEGSIFTVR